MSLKGTAAVFVATILGGLIVSNPPIAAQLDDDLEFGLARFDSPDSEGSDLSDLPVIVQYWNGRIDQSGVVIRLSSFTASYTLQPIGTAGTQMLVIPAADQLADYVYGPQLDEPYMYVLGVPVRSDDNGMLSESGIEVDFVSFSANPCQNNDNCWPTSLFDQKVYASLDILTETVSGTTKPKKLYGPGDRFWVDGEGGEGNHLVAVNERIDGAFNITVTPRSEIDWDALDPWWEGRFRDDEGNVHETALDALAEREILIGFETTDRKINPKRNVTRRDMAVMLTRALGAEPTPGETSRFSDVPANAWFGPAINHLASINVVNGYPDGTFKPNTPVTRAQFASFIVRAFPQYSPVKAPARIFADVSPSSAHAATTQALYEAGITRGCETEPLRYCPSDQLRRDQVASFLARVLGLV